MRILGLDFGEKRIGVSVSDPFGWTAQALTVISRQKGDSINESIDELSKIVDQYSVTEFLLGFPKNMNDSLGVRAEETIEFMNTLKKHFNIPVTLWDERLSSVSAERTLIESDISRKKRKKVIDKIASAIILQNYLDYKQRNV